MKLDPAFCAVVCGSICFPVHFIIFTQNPSALPHSLFYVFFIIFYTQSAMFCCVCRILLLKTWILYQIYEGDCVYHCLYDISENTGLCTILVCLHSLYMHGRLYFQLHFIFCASRDRWDYSGYSLTHLKHFFEHNMDISYTLLVGFGGL